MMAMKVTPAGLKGTANADHTGAMPGEITVAEGEVLTIWPPLDSSYVMVSTADGTRGMLSTSLVTLDPGQGAALPAPEAAPQRAKTVAEEIVMTERGFCKQLVQVRDVYGNFAIIFDHFSRCSQRYTAACTTPHARCAVLYFVPIRTGC